MHNILHTIAWVGGLSTAILVIAVILLSIFAKPLLDAIMAVLLPILQAVGDGLGVVLRTLASWLWSVFAVALPDFFSGPWQDRVALLIIVSSAFFGGMWYNGSHNCPDVSPSVRAEYKLLPRTAKEKALWKLQHPGEWF